MATQEPKKYSETHLEKIYSKVYEVETESGKVYPKNKVTVDLYSYDGEYTDREGKNIPYEGEKVKIVNAKLVLEDGQYVKKKKVVGSKMFNDETSCVLSKQDYEDLIGYIKSDDFPE
jgi:hypothetical protein